MARRWLTAFRLWLARLFRGWAEALVTTTATVSVGGPPLAAPWDGVGPKHEVRRGGAAGVPEKTYTFKSGAEATAFYQWAVDHREPGFAEFLTDGVVRSRYEGGE